MGSQAGPPMKIKVVSIDQTPCDLIFRDFKIFLEEIFEEKIAILKTLKIGHFGGQCGANSARTKWGGTPRSDVFRDLAKTYPKIVY